MSAAALLIAASTWSMQVWISIPPKPGAPVSAPADPDEVIVNGTRVRRLELRVRTERKTGAVACSLKRESGDPKLDAALCGEAVACNATPLRRKLLEACMMPRVGAVIRARYPDRAISPPTQRGEPTGTYL